MYVLVDGDLRNGFTFYGPFSEYQKAASYRSRIFAGQRVSEERPVMIVPVHKPTDHLYKELEERVELCIQEGCPNAGRHAKH